MTCAAGRAAEAGEEGAVASAGESLETLNAFRAHEIIERHFATHPEQPALWTENWIGWYQTWGGCLPQRDPAELAYSTARFFAAGGSGVNYFLWHGGTNFNRESMYLGTTAYEFGGALDEYGLPSTKARALAPLNRALAACSAQLLSGGRPRKVEPAAGVVEYHYDGGLIFHCDDNVRRVRIVREGVTLYDSAARITPVTRTWRSAGVRLAPWGHRPEPLPSAWPAELSTAVISPKPVEQPQEHRHDQQQRANLQPGDRHRLGQSAKVYEEIGDNARKHPVVQDARNPGEDAREHAELLRIPDLEKLSHREHACLPVAVGHPTAHRDEHRHRRQHLAPPKRRKTRLIELLEIGDDARDAKRRDALRQRQHIAPRAAVGREEIRHAPRVGTDPNGDARQRHSGREQNKPIQWGKLHG
jgi:hypothetical protein